MEDQDKMTYYFIVDSRKLSRDDMLRLERVAAIEAKQMQWMLFVRYSIRNYGLTERFGTSVSLN
jgi:hypothetical protein